MTIARDTLRLYLNKQQVPALSAYPATATLQKECGVFVTLKNKNNGELRGCIGYIYGERPCVKQYGTARWKQLPATSGLLPCSQGKSKQ